MNQSSECRLRSLSGSVLYDPESANNKTSTKVSIKLCEDKVSLNSSAEDDADNAKPSNIHVFSASSTLHGFSHIFALYHSSLRRFAWTVAFLASLTLLLVQSSNRVRYYLDFPHVTRLDEVTDQILIFPAVTICNVNEFKFRNITKNDMYHAGQLLGFLHKNNSLRHPSFYAEIENMKPGPMKTKLQNLKDDMDKLTDFNSFYAEPQFNMFEFYNRTGYSLSDVLLSCKYRGKQCNLSLDFIEEISENIKKYEATSFINEGCRCAHLPASMVKQKQFVAEFHGDDVRTTIEDNLNEQVNTSSVTPPNSQGQSGKTEKELKPSDIMFFAANSTFHGVGHICTPRNVTFRNLIWAFAFFSSLGLFLNQAYDRYAYYRSHPHVTKLDEQEAIVATFPSITICNMNSFRLSSLTTDDFYYAGEHLFQLFDSDRNIKNSKFRDNKTWPYVKEKLQRIIQQQDDYTPTMKQFNMFEFYNRTGHQLFGMVKSCRYKGVNCLNSSMWIAVFTRYGKCYMFNSGKKSPALETLKGGIDNGLEVLLDTQQDDYMPVWAETDEISVEAGFKVQVHVQTEPPFIHELGFGISPGFQTLVATQEQRITFLPDPYGKCSNGFDRSKHQYFDYYSISACRITCETKFVFKNCSCRMIHMPDESMPYCDPERYRTCADKALDYLLRQDQSICLCDTPCNVTRYNLEMSSLQLPSTQALSYLAQKFQKSEEYVKNNFVKLNIFFEALNYETIEQKVAYELPGLFGDIGGQMGLFIGASILTILELFDYIYEVIKEKILRRRRHKTKKHCALKNSGCGNLNKSVDIICPERGGRNGTSSQHHNVDSQQPTTLCEYSGMSQAQAKNPFNTRRFDNLPHHSPHQYIGKPFPALYEDRSIELKSAEPRLMQNTFQAPHQMASDGGRETSVSYNDLHRIPANSWRGFDISKSPNCTAPRSLAINFIASPNEFDIPNSTLNDTVPSTNRNGGHFNMTRIDDCTPNQPYSRVRNPDRPFGDLQLNFHSIETEIH